MAITSSSLKFTDESGRTITSGSLHSLFDAARVGAATDYRTAVITNTHPTLSLSAAKIWLIRGPGAALAIAIADGATSAVEFSDVSLSALTYSTAASKAAAVSLPAPATLAPGQSCRIAIRRTLSGAATAEPQTARLYIGGTSPL